ncbi:MAG: hypothetical protein JXB48_18250 [Candidatus Latescibacteria bacterium]|nr:hypothetical protein [Candidatus Latescibacterota bacterium]
MHHFLTILFAVSIALTNVTTAACETIFEREQQRKELNDRLDKLHLRQKTGFVVDRSPEFLREPETVPAVVEHTVSKTSPEVKLMIIPDMKPEYYFDMEEGAESYMFAWANWAKVARSDDNRFFFSVSDHRGVGCHINLYEYNPGRDLVHKVLDVSRLLGWTDHTLTDGKIHGHMGIMPDGTLWGATHYGVYPDSSWWANGYRGSWLFSYNINTHEAKNWGVPLVGNMLPDFTVDTARGRLVGTGANETVLCWDCINRKVTYAGYPPNGWIWWRRGMFLDCDTGKFWSTDTSDDRHRFISFDPEFNRFERYELSGPVNPYFRDPNASTDLRGYTDRPALDGYYYCNCENGAFFKFKPQGSHGPEIVPLGVTWRVANQAQGRADFGMDVLQQMVSPGGRFIYYLPQYYPAPLVQYDIKTGKKKALCWLYDYYFEKYGYWIGGCYGAEISTDGSFVVACINGAFKGNDLSQGIGNIAYGHPAIIIIEIPASEREE